MYNDRHSNRYFLEAVLGIFWLLFFVFSTFNDFFCPICADFLLQSNILFFFFEELPEVTAASPAAPTPSNTKLPAPSVANSANAPSPMITVPTAT